MDPYLPEIYTPPFGGPAAALVLATGLVWLAVLMIRSPHTDRPEFHAARLRGAVVSSALAVLVLLVPYPMVWLGSGALWNVIASKGLDDRLIENALLWCPTILLVVSLALAQFAGASRRRLAGWAVLTGAGLLLTSFAVTVLGLAGGAG